MTRVCSAQERAINDEFTALGVGKEDQHQTGNIQRTHWMPIKEALNSANHRGRLSVAAATLGESSVANIFRLNQRQDKEGEQLHLIFAVFGKMGSET